MRNRAHMCAMCSGVDEAHHKRHQDMAERLRNIYKSCGEDWSIIPSDEPERGRPRGRESEEEGNEEEDRSSTSGGAHAKKKDKKEQKRLIRAASRRRVITLEEIQHIESVLHPASTNGDAEGPRNPEEIEEIERHLRYNAQVYNTGAKRRVIKDFAHISDADVDFEAEMERILESLRVTELLRRNTKNRGMQGKELKQFEELVAGFKERVVEDLVLLKKEEMEVRMRRASYLRYTNRASFNIVEERYAAKDWKTGLKFSESPAVHSMSSGSLTAIDEESEQEEEDESVADWREEREFSTPTSAGPDLRHLLQGHKRIGSGGRLEDCESIIRSSTGTQTQSLDISNRLPPLRIVPSAQTAVREPSPPRSLISVDSENIPSWSKRHPPAGQVTSKHMFANEEGWQSVRRGVRKGSTPTKRQASPALPGTSRWAFKTHTAWEDPYLDVADDSSNTASSSDTAQEVSIAHIEKKGKIRPSSEDAPQGSKVCTAGSEPKLIKSEVKTVSLDTLKHTEGGHPVVEQKKAKKKKQREAERKARRTAEREHDNFGDIVVEDYANPVDSDSTNATPMHLPSISRSAERSEEGFCGGPVLPVKPSMEKVMCSKGTAVEGPPTVMKVPRLPLTPVANCSLNTVTNEKPMPFMVGKASPVDIPARNTTKQTKANSELTEPVMRCSPSTSSYPSQLAPQGSMVTMKNGHHSDWKKFTLHLKVRSSPVQVHRDREAAEQQSKRLTNTLLMSFVDVAP
jgi:hypothetical protein